MNYVKQGEIFTFKQNASDVTFKTLPVGTYCLKSHPEIGFYLEPIADFTMPKRIYGDLVTKADRILNTFDDRPAQTGVLLSGTKGSGKTLMAKYLSLAVAKKNMPTILINTPFFGEGFNTLIASIEQPVMVLFDEFEKVYEDRQPELLTLLDGVYKNKKLFVFTSNDVYKIDQHMINRPGRLYYNLNYKGLPDDFIIDYCTENLKDQTKIKSVCFASRMFWEINFDMLQAMVEEMNRYNCSIREVLEMLNVTPDYRGERTYQVKSFSIKGIDQNVEHYTFEIPSNPLKGNLYVYTRVDVDEDDSDEAFDALLSEHPLVKLLGEDKDLSYTPDFIETCDFKKDLFVYSDPENQITLTLEPKPMAKSYADAWMDM